MYECCFTMVKIFLNMELFYLIMVIKGEPRLVILKNVYDSRTEVSSIVVTSIGQNLSLFCRLEDQIDNQVVWRTAIGFKFMKLSFTPVMSDNQGIYFCTSLKYNISKFVYIIVTSNKLYEFQNHRRMKRANLDNDNYTTHPPRQHSKASIKRFKSKVWSNTSLKELDRSYFKTENQKTLVNSFGPLLYIVAIAALSLVIFVLYIVYQQAKHADEEIPACNHPLCVRLRATNPSHGCILETIISNNNRLNERIITMSNFMNPLMISDNRNNYAQRDYLDLPPSYCTSISSDLPPSYDEAIASLSDQLHDARSSPTMPSNNGTN